LFVFLGFATPHAAYFVIAATCLIWSAVVRRLGPGD
jgi:hypothetical protein